MVNFARRASILFAETSAFRVYLRGTRVALKLICTVAISKKFILARDFWMISFNIDSNPKSKRNLRAINLSSKVAIGEIHRF